jgi:hypothetical protein
MRSESVVQCTDVTVRAGEGGLEGNLAVPEGAAVTVAFVHGGSSRAQKVTASSVVHVAPVHGAWLRQRGRIVDWASKAALPTQLVPCMAEAHELAHPVTRTTASVANVRADAGPTAA